MNADHRPHLIWALSVLACACSHGCTGTAASPNENLNQNAASFSLEETIAGMLTDLQRARDCGDLTTPLPTAEQLEAALMTTHQETAETLPFEDYVLQQAQIFRDHADVQCGITAGENADQGAAP